MASVTRMHKIRRRRTAKCENFPPFRKHLTMRSFDRPLKKFPRCLNSFSCVGKNRAKDTNLTSPRIGHFISNALRIYCTLQFFITHGLFEWKKNHINLNAVMKINCKGPGKILYTIICSKYEICVI